MRVAGRVSGAVLVVAMATAACNAVLGLQEQELRSADAGGVDDARADVATDSTVDGPMDAGGDSARDGLADGTSDDGGADVDGASVVAPSCQGLASTCGASGTESCCTSLPVPGGSFKRSYDGVSFTDPSFPATLSGFRLDKYEITVGRFRKFVDAVVGADGGVAFTPSAGTGKHAHLNGGGGLNAGTEGGWGAPWSTTLATTPSGWNTNLGCDATYTTWTASAGANEDRPINCVAWHEAYAFCIWDGGFLPSEAEWNYAASGGSEQRVYPWGALAPGPNANLAIYGCYYNGSGTCTGVQNIASVGSVTAGNGKWGHADLAGNIWEWTLDFYATPYQTSCTNCADLSATAYRVIRGGGFDYVASDLLSAIRFGDTPSGRYGAIGGRCARAP